MSMAIAGEVKNVLSLKLKSRPDSHSDQFSRIFLVKLMMVGSLVIGLNWYNDKVLCIVPKSLGLDDKYVSAACWINGLYVYDEIRNQTDDAAYFGLPREIDKDGRLDSGVLCSVYDNSHLPTPGCKPLTKKFFLHYQYLVFYVASLAIWYYSPYILFKIVNSDMLSLKATVRG